MARRRLGRENEKKDRVEAEERVVDNEPKQINEPEEEKDEAKEDTVEKTIKFS